VRICVAYIFPQVSLPTYTPMARRFVLQYLKYPPGETDHDLYVVLNGGNGSVAEWQRKVFEPLAPQFIHHNNVGRDLGGYVHVAQTIPCDLLVCIGSPARPRLDCWLDLMVRAVEENGPGLFGIWGFHVPALHIRTTVFWLPPQILAAYPHHIDDHNRYEVEHGATSIARFCVKKGFPVLQVTRRGVFPIEQFHHVEVQDCLFLDQHYDYCGVQDDGSGW
jgi:hypothetical protein